MLTREIMSRTLKHNSHDPALEVTLQYGRVPAAQALSLHTQQATQLL